MRSSFLVACLGLLSLAAPTVSVARAEAASWRRVGLLRASPGQAPGATRWTRTRVEGDRETWTLEVGALPISEVERGGQVWLVPELPGGGDQASIGAPRRPTWGTLLESEPGVELLLEDANFEWSAQVLRGRLYPHQPIRSEDAPPAPFAYDLAAYEATGDAFASRRIELLGPRKGWGAGTQVLRICPLRYLPRRDEVHVLRRATLTFRRLGLPAPGPAVQGPPAPAYVVVTPRRFRAPLEPFLVFKRQQHPDLQLLVVEDLGSDLASIDAAVEDLAARGAEYVLLVGHSSLVPAAEYDSPWDRDELANCFDADAVYRNRSGEDRPSLKVGRIPGRKPHEIERAVAKILRRWRALDTAWRTPVLVAHEEDAPGKYQGCVRDIVETALPGGVVTPRLVLPAAPEVGGLGSRLPDFFDALRPGAGVLLYRGHGEEASFDTRLLDDFGATPRHWQSFPNITPPLFYSVACLQGRMTNIQGKPRKNLMNRFLTTTASGAAGGLAAIHLSPTEPNSVFAWHLMHRSYQDPVPSLGEVFQYALTKTLLFGVDDPEQGRYYRKLGELYNLYGDPEMPVR